MDKHDIAHIFDQMGILHELKGENPFKVRAYHKAARTLESLNEDIDVIIREERLETFPGIGKDFAKKITTLWTTGHLAEYEELKKSIPKTLIELLEVPTLGCKKIKLLYDKLGIETIDELVSACNRGKIAELKGFKPKTIENILKGVNKLKSYSKAMLWWKAEKIVQMILDKIGKIEEVEKVAVAGSFRRKMEIIGDLDFVVASEEPQIVMEKFQKQPFVSEILQQGQTKITLRIKQGPQIDVRVVPLKQFDFSLLYFTGSKNHNIKLRQLALKKGLSLNEYGFDKFPNKKMGEKEIYQTLGLPYIPPELREDADEFAAKTIPKLIEESDIRGVFHCHTTESDGHNSLEEMVQGAIALGFEYIGISDHSQSSFQANGMDETRLFHQIETIRKIKKKITVFAGLECDIMNDGTLDFSDDILKHLDFVIVSVHRRYKADEKTMTKRLIKAIENPYTTMVGHLTGRLLLARDPYPLNVEKVIDAAIANSKIIELNAHPNRLDMDWRFWHYAKEKGLKCSINPDAHSVQELENYRYGVNVARKGWLTKSDVLNAWSLKKVKSYLNL